MAKGWKKRRGSPAYTGTADTRRDRHARRASGQDRYGLSGSRARLAIVAFSAALALVVTVAVVLTAGDSGSEFTVYQGQDRLGGSTASVDDLLDDGVPLVLNF